MTFKPHFDAMKKHILMFAIISASLFSNAQIPGILDIKFLSTIAEVKAAMLKKGAKFDLKNSSPSTGAYVYSGLQIGGYSSTSTIFHFKGGELVMASVLFATKNDPEAIEIYNNLEYGLTRQYGIGIDRSKAAYPFDMKDRNTVSAISSGYVTLKHGWDDGDKFIGRIDLTLTENLLPTLVYSHRPTLTEVQMAKDRQKQF